MAQVRLLESRAAHALFGHRDHFLLGDGHLEQDGLGRIVEPIDVLFQLEGLAAVDPHALEHAVTVQEAVVEDGDLGVIAVVPLAVNVDDSHSTPSPKAADNPGISHRREMSQGAAADGRGRFAASTPRSDISGSGVDEGGGNRTHDLEIKSLLLYQLSYALGRPKRGPPARETQGLTRRE